MRELVFSVLLAWCIWFEWPSYDSVSERVKWPIPEMPRVVLSVWPNRLDHAPGWIRLPHGKRARLRW